jgi:hypothetical protein
MKMQFISAVCIWGAALVAASPVDACTQIKEWLSVCTQASDWEAVIDDDGETLFRDPQNNKGQVLVYKDGTADGLSVEDAAVAAVKSDKKASQSYDILARGKMPSGNIVFTSAAKRDDVDYVYATTLSMGAKVTVRITTWRRGIEVREADRLAHRAFGALVKVEGSH